MSCDLTSKYFKSVDQRPARGRLSPSIPKCQLGPTDIQNTFPAGLPLPPPAGWWPAIFGVAPSLCLNKTTAALQPCCCSSTMGTTTRRLILLDRVRANTQVILVLQLLTVVFKDRSFIVSKIAEWFATVGSTILLFYLTF